MKGLRDIHRMNVIHKDIKPANMVSVFVNSAMIFNQLYNQETGRILYLDFGCSTRIQEELEQNSDLKNRYGTLAYISPV